MYDKNSEEAKAGRRGEAVARAWFIANGWGVLHCADFGAVGATMFEGSTGKIISLDLLLARGGISRWVDVKWKNGAVKYQIGNVRRHGIDRQHWDHYLVVESMTGISGALAIVQLRELRGKGPIAPRLLFASLATLKGHLADGLNHFGPPNEAFRKGSVNWDVSNFDDLGPIDVGSDTLPATRLALHPWEGVDRHGLPPVVPDKHKQAVLSEERQRRGTDLFEHYCRCGKFGSFGYGVNLRAGVTGEWFCAEHRPMESNT